MQIHIYLYGHLEKYDVQTSMLHNTVHRTQTFVFYYKENQDSI